MQANWWQYKFFHFLLPFWIWKVWKGREKITKTWISWERKELFRWNEKHFHSFWKAIIWWKNKNLIKNSGQKLFNISIGRYHKDLLICFHTCNFFKTFLPVCTKEYGYNNCVCQSRLWYSFYLQSYSIKVKCI